MPTPNDHLAPRTGLIAVGEAAPDFTLPDADRKDWSLAEAVKKGDVVLCFFPFAFTGVCTTEMKCVSGELATWKAKGAQVVGISCDSFAALKAFAAAEGLTHTLLSDIHRHVCKAYGLYWADLNVSQRGTVVIGKSADGKGKVKWVQARPPSEAMDFEIILSLVG
ncbi:MAG: redoxin domain-containing protein [Phycisphaeraceae bacterium]|nr:MAG: redoxin domain-containing protein [Phycisphaeraceae bacterium]